MTADTPIEPHDVLDFWLALKPEQYFEKDPALDAEITQRFQAHHEAAKAGAYDVWQATPEGTLALIILLDQFARNIYRDRAEAFAADPKALALAKAAIERGADMALEAELRQWIYMPFEHSEAIADQRDCVRLFERSGLDESATWARHHAEIIERFGRFPHRNAVLGRTTTPEEQAFLDEGGFSG